MLSHIVKDLHEVYVTEVIEPQIGKDKSDKSEKPSESDGGGKNIDDQAAKRIRQAVYDIRYRARREDIAIDQAYNQYMSHTSMNAMEKGAVREKLGLGTSGGAGTSVREENLPEANRYLRVDPRKRGTGEKVYYKKFDPSNPKDLAKRHKLETRGIKTTATQYVPKSGMPYDDQAGEKYEKKYGKGGKNTVGDLDGDGAKEPNSHEYAGVKDKAIKKAISADKKGNKVKKNVKEGFSDWRDDISEVVEKLNDIKSKEIKEKNVNNKITINPTINIENFSNDSEYQLIETVELNETEIDSVINSATEYFYECGLNEDGIDILIENIGNDNFIEYIFDIASDLYLEEAVNVKSLSGSARKKAGVTAAHISKSGKKLTGAAKSKSIETVKAARAERKSAPEQTERQKTLARLQSAQRERNIAKAKSSQASTPKKEAPSKTKKGILDRVAGAVLSGIERHKAATTATSSAFKKGMERHKAATTTASHLAKETGKTAAKAGKIAAHAATSAASGAAKTAKVMKKVVTGEEVELEALDTWHPETTTDTSDQNRKIQSKIKEKQKKVKVSSTPSYLPPLSAILKTQSVKKESAEIVEVAPPGAKFERMIKHIKKGYADGGLTKKEKSIAYATAWKKYNKKGVSEATVSNIPGKTSLETQPNTTEVQKDTEQKQLKTAKQKAKQKLERILIAKRDALKSGVTSISA